MYLSSKNKSRINTVEWDLNIGTMAFNASLHGNTSIVSINASHDMRISFLLILNGYSVTILYRFTRSVALHVFILCIFVRLLFICILLYEIL